MVGLCKYSLKNYGPINLLSVIYGSSNVNCINVKTNKNSTHIPLEYMVKTSRSCLRNVFFPGVWGGCLSCSQQGADYHGRV
jgi:hypothetical protein